MSVFDIFKKIEQQNNSSISGSVEYIICGLGNPGTKYEDTRHNCGFMAVDTICEINKITATKLKFKSLTGEAMLGGKHCLIMKPTTFMNNSGEAVLPAMQFYKLPPEKLIVIVDDISLPVGKMRIRMKGSAGGHNGLKSIISLIGSDNFARIKIGVGEKPHPDFDLADWVLSRFTKEEGVELEKAFQNAAASTELLVEGKKDEAMNKYNS